MRRQAARVFRKSSALTPSSQQFNRKGEDLHDGKLAEMFRGARFSNWVPPVETLNWLLDRVNRHGPRIVLEFGSGITTTCLCHALRQIHGPDGFRLLSIEQDAMEVERTKERLRSLGRRLPCRIVHVPLIPATVGDRSTFFYDVKQCGEHFEWLGQAQFVFIDGPFADGPCRYGTLSQVRAYLAPDARFAMDDALRAKELLAGALWSREGIVIEGIFTVGQGVMVGSVPGQSAKGKGHSAKGRAHSAKGPEIKTTRAKPAKNAKGKVNIEWRKANSENVFAIRHPKSAIIFILALLAR